MSNHDPIVERQIASATRALDQMEAAWGANSRKLIPHLRYLADLYFALNEFATAEALYLRLLTVVTKTFGYHDPEVAAALQMLGEVCEMQGLNIEAERYYLWALDVRQRNKESDAQLQMLLARLANLYRSDSNGFKSKVIENKLIQVVCPAQPAMRRCS